MRRQVPSTVRNPVIYNNIFHISPVSFKQHSNIIPSALSLKDGLKSKVIAVKLSLASPLLSAVPCFLVLLQ